MKKNLFICETPFQVLASILIIYDLQSTDINDFILVDTMNNSTVLAKNLKNHPLVRHVMAANTIKSSRNIINKINFIADMFIPFDNRWHYSAIETVYDCFYCRNYTSIITESAFRFFKKKNPKMKLIIIDEGYSSYLSNFWNSHNEISFFHKLSSNILNGHKNYLYNNITDAKFFLPELFHIELPFKISTMLKNNFILNEQKKEEINRVFSYTSNTKINESAYIFFEECFSFDCGNNNDLEIIEQLSKILGKEKIIIKQHPRSQKDRFSSLGYSVMENADYPWEIFVINNANKAISLLAFSSGALLNHMFFVRSKMKSILLYKIFPEKYKHMLSDEINRWFTEFSMMYENYIFTPSSLEELVNIINK